MADKNGTEIKTQKAKYRAQQKQPIQLSRGVLDKKYPQNLRDEKRKSNLSWLNWNAGDDGHGMTKSEL